MSVRLLCTTLLLAVIGTSTAQAQVTSPRPPRNKSQSQTVPVESSPKPAGPRKPLTAEDDVRVTPVTPVRGPAAVAARTASNPIIECPWEPLAPQDQQFLDKLLSNWEQHSSKIQRYRCDFDRWEYDPVFGPLDPKTGQPDPAQAKSYGKGKLRYGAPDKGMFKVDELSVFVPPKEPGAKPEWLKRPAEEINEHWVCDGRYVFMFNTQQKQLSQIELPPEKQGKAIVDGPLPFLFGAKADKIKARYHVRVITPKEVEGEFWIEAAPKFATDAENFKMVHVIIDAQDFLPKAIQVFDPGFNPQKNWKRTVITFKSREVNFNVLLEQIRFWEAEFSSPRTPIGWKKVVEPYSPEPTEKALGPMAQKPNPAKVPFKFR